ncbi:GNAT family N-acetyltransferase [Moheibacter lacus]|uniref:GNAT family N-acetyltransferase n=1 Tax=Moheibacter lacus TaxID=2745851 RepID=A0A838ZQI5_9FLAO|nr:GNAT family N-acetyltransferase [Moheibacter lacus]MBA5628172.1 GNAT family N-acetyltransferase [Moheibacter lacus]
MKIHLETDRLIIREIELTDVDDFFELDADPEVHKYILQTPVKSKDEIVEIIKMIRQQYQDNGIARWAVTDKVSGEMLGWCGIKYFTDKLNGHQNFYEHGYRFKQKHWSKGYATESSKAILDWAFENLNTDKIYAITDLENIGSIHVLIKLGFELKEVFQYDEKLKCNWFELEKYNLNA